MTAPGTGKSHLAHAIGHATIQQGQKVLYREAFALIEEMRTPPSKTSVRSTWLFWRLSHCSSLMTSGCGKLPATAAEDLLELVMRRCERASTLMTSNRPVEDWGKLLGDTAAVTALLDRALHHAHVLKCGPRLQLR